MFTLKMVFCGSANGGITQKHSIMQGPEFNSQNQGKNAIHGITLQKFKTHRERQRKKELYYAKEEGLKQVRSKHI